MESIIEILDEAIAKLNKLFTLEVKSRFVKKTEQLLVTITVTGWQDEYLALAKMFNKATFRSEPKLVYSFVLGFNNAIVKIKAPREISQDVVDKVMDLIMNDCLLYAHSLKDYTVKF